MESLPSDTIVGAFSPETLQACPVFGLQQITLLSLAGERSFPFEYETVGVFVDDSLKKDGDDIVSDSDAVSNSYENYGEDIMDALTHDLH